MNNKLPLMLLAFAAGAAVGFIGYRTASAAAAEGKLNTQELKAGLNALSKAFASGTPLSRGMGGGRGMGGMGGMGGGRGGF